MGEMESMEPGKYFHYSFVLFHNNVSKSIQGI